MREFPNYAQARLEKRREVVEKRIERLQGQNLPKQTAYAEAALERIDNQLQAIEHPDE